MPTEVVESFRLLAVLAQVAVVAYKVVRVLWRLRRAAERRRERGREIAGAVRTAA